MSESYGFKDNATQNAVLNAPRPSSESADADEKEISHLRGPVRNGVFSRCRDVAVRDAELAAAGGSQPQTRRSAAAAAKVPVQAGPELAQEARAVHRGGVRRGCQSVLWSGVCGSER